MPHEVVLDIETQNSFADAGNDIKKLRLSVVSVYDYGTDKYYSFIEEELTQLWPLLEKAERLIGYNSAHFDLPILNNYYPGDLTQFPHLDLIVPVKDSLGKRIKLDDIAKATLDNVTKSADGLQAIRWWQEGKIDEIKKYCEQDVKITKEVYEFGRNNRQLFYTSLTGEILPFAVNFQPPPQIAQAQPVQQNINLTLPL